MNLSTSVRPQGYISSRERAKNNLVKRSLMDYGDLFQKLCQLCQKLKRAPGAHSRITMKAAGFEYTDVGDAARCSECGLEVSGWTPDIRPFTVHKQQNPTCQFVLSTLSSRETRTSSASYNEESPCKKLKTDTTIVTSLPILLVEVDSLKQIRKRTFSHWPHRSSPSAAQMIMAGFFNCNVGDRVICIYCNIICQQWTTNNDDPCEVHKTLSPKCPYVVAMLTTSQSSSISIINEASASVDLISSEAVVHTAACNSNYMEIPKRAASFVPWPIENLPSVEDLVRAGFFFTGTKTTVTCFYCNGSLQNWGANDNPMIEHARWFPHCAYAKQLCGAELHRKIQESKRAQQERARVNDTENGSATAGGNSNNARLLIPDESTLSRLVAARLDLPISQSLLDRNSELSIIKRCWEDQLRLKHEDFACDSDLLMACIILQKLMKCIDGKKENISVPSIAMKRIRDKEQRAVHLPESAATTSSSINTSGGNDVEMTTSSPGSEANDSVLRVSTITSEILENRTSAFPETSLQSHINDVSILNPCTRCLLEAWCPALLSCIHYPAEPSS